MAYGGTYNASIGIKLPNGTYEGPIGKDRLFWVRPGKGSIKKILQSKNAESKLFEHLRQAVGHSGAKKTSLWFFILLFCHPQSAQASNVVA